MRKKLLLADDSITIQKVVELTFPAEEFQVVTAGNGRLAVEKAATFLPDIVLCDVIMPQLDGYQVCEALRAMPDLKDVPILLLNGAFEPYDPERAKAAGALGNVSKPFDPPALVAKVKEILAARVPAPVPVETVPFEPEPPGVDAFSWDDSEGQAISTMEVPSDIRAFAARSMALDTPVFATVEPEPEPEPESVEAFSPETFSPESLPEVESDTPNFSATLHDALDPIESPVAEPSFDLELEPAAAEAGPDVSEPAVPTTELSPSTIEDAYEPSPEAELVSSVSFTDETEALAPMTFEENPPATFEDAPAQVEASMPTTLPPMASPFAPPSPVVDAESASPLPSESEPEAEFEPQSFEPQSFEPQTFEPPPVEAAADLEPGVPAVEPMAVASTSPETSFDFEPAATDPAIEGGDAPSVEAIAPEALPATTADTMDGAPTDSGTAVASEVAVPVEMVQQIAQRVISQVSERVIREIAWDVIPALAEKLIKAEIERIKARAESERD